MTCWWARRRDASRLTSDGRPSKAEADPSLRSGSFRAMRGRSMNGSDPLKSEVGLRRFLPRAERQMQNPRCARDDMLVGARKGCFAANVRRAPSKAEADPSLRSGSFRAMRGRSMNGSDPLKSEVGLRRFLQRAERQMQNPRCARDDMLGGVRVARSSSFTKQALLSKLHNQSFAKRAFAPAGRTSGREEK
jgi:hypothetical protein